ncbi:MAG: hypothetical protein VB980_03985 [Opitutales bacterium]
MQSNAQTDEMLDQLIFGDDSPSLNLESPETETPPSPAAETPVSSLGEYNTGMVKWSKDFSIRVDAGYADNALLSPFKKDGSGFLRSTFDTFLYRPITDSGFQTYLYALGEINLYDDLEGMDVSSLFMVQNELGWTGLDGVESGFRVKYTYYDQVYDASFDEFDQSSATVQSNQFEIRPFLRSPVGENGFVGAELAGVRVLYENSSEDYFEGHFRTFMGRYYGHGSKVELDLKSIWREYDERVRRERSGYPMSGTLKRRSLGGGLTWLHSIHEKPHWRTRINASFMTAMDNGSSYYDYDLGRVKMSLIRNGEKWKTNASIGFSHYDYQSQLGDNGESKLFRKTIETSLSLERSLGENWALFLEGRREMDDSNLRSYKYNANVVSIGGERSL